MKVCLLALIVLSAFACHSQPPHSPSEIGAAMEHYDSLLKKMDADSIAWIYAPDGQLGTMARGRDSIRRFLATFKNVRVLQVGSTTTNTTITGDSAAQSGAYFQTVLLNNKDTVHVKGSFQTEWIWMDIEGWKIRRMTTNP